VEITDRPSREGYLQDDKQPNIQKELDFSTALRGEAQEAGREGTESGR